MPVPLKKGRPGRPLGPAAAPARPTAASLSLSSDSELSVEPLVLLPPDGGYGWVVVVACFFMNLFTDGAIYSFGFYQKSVREEFAKEAAEVALLASLCAGFYYIAGPIWSAVGNRWGFRSVSVVGSVMSAAAFASCFFINDYGLFIFVYGVVLGGASGAVYMATMISVGFYFERWRGVATSLTSCGSGVGVLVLPMCYKYMSTYAGYTWRWILMLNACIFGLVLLLSLLLKPLQPIPVSMMRTERTVRFQDAKMSPETSLAGVPIQGRRGKFAVPSSSTLRQLHASQTSISPSVQAPQFDAISMTSRAFPRSGPDAKDMQAGARPMYRDDIFYGASASRLSSQMSTRLMATLSPTTTDTFGDEGGEEAVVSPLGRCCAWMAQCIFCPHAVKSTLVALLNHSILSNTVFLMFAATQVFFMMGYFTPYLFSQDQALKTGVSPEIAEWMLPSLGVANAVGRGLAGLLCEVPGVSTLKLACASLTVASAIVATTYLSANPIYQITASAAYGFFIAPFMAMKSLILVDFLGIERLTNSFGLLLMFQGFAVMMGPPLIGWIYDMTKSYQYVYIISGSLLFIASVTPYLMYPLSNYEQRKEMRQSSRRSS